MSKYGAGIMDRQSLKALAEFCVEQHEAFNAPAWTDRNGVDASNLAGAAEYLSLTSWYGHEDALASVASKLRAGVARQAAPDDGIPLSDFSVMTRYLIALRRIELADNVDNGGQLAKPRG